MPRAGQEWRMSILEAERRGAVATSCCGRGQALLKIDVGTQQEFLLERVDEVEAVFVVGVDVKARRVAVTILVLAAGEAQASSVELIADAGVVIGLRVVRNRYARLVAGTYLITGDTHTYGANYIRSSRRPDCGFRGYHSAVSERDSERSESLRLRYFDDLSARRRWKSHRCEWHALACTRRFRRDNLHANRSRRLRTSGPDFAF